MVLKSINNQSLLIVKPKTGRKHQIRRHFYDIGHPVVGDDKYNNLDDIKSNKLFLHSFSIQFLDKKKVRKIFFAPPPEYFIQTLNLFGFNKLEDIKVKLNF